MKQMILDIAPAPAPTLDGFVSGRNGELLVSLYAPPGREADADPVAIALFRDEQAAAHRRAVLGAAHDPTRASFTEVFASLSLSPSLAITAFVHVNASIA